MKKKVIYMWLIVILLVLNVLQLAFFFKNQHAHHRCKIKDQGGFKKEVINTLNLDQNQQKQFFDLAKKHREQIKKLKQQHKKIMVAYFDKPSDALLDSIKYLEGKKLQITQQHFVDIQQILNDEQKVKFRDFKHRRMPKIFK